MSSKYVDIPANIQVIGAVYENPNILDNENYHFNEDDFTEEFHRILFGSIYNLHVLGAKKINEITIANYLEQRPKKLAVFKANKGEEYLAKLKETTQTAAFDYYYQRMKKMTLLRMYSEKAGMDLSWLYDIDNLFDQKKKEKQEEWLDNTDISEIVELIDNKIEQIKSKYLNNTDETCSQAGENALELVDKLLRTPEIGYPLYGDIANTIHRGARLGKLYLRSASTGVGKALPNSTVIPTPIGKRKVSDIQVGDYLFDAFGKPTKVLGVYPQGRKEVLYVRFKDGRVARCCEDHLWSYCTVGQKDSSKKERKFYTKTLKELRKEKLQKSDGGYRILVPMNYAVEYEEQYYYIPPYIMGLALGDGSFRQNESNKAFQFSSENEFLPNYIGFMMNWEVKKNKANYGWYFSFKGKAPHENVWVQDFLKQYPELLNTKSETKFIPEEYLRGSIEQRFDLLNGLLDTDGSVDEKGRINYYTISPFLRDNVVELCHSLGFKTTVLVDSHKDTNIGFIIRITGRPDDKVKLFKLPRKKEIIKAWYNNNTRKESNEFNPIIEIGSCGYTEEMTCFMVDNKEHLFLTEDYIVTHNTRAMIADACTIACGELYNKETGKWVHNGTKEPSFYITTEQDKDEVQTMMLAFLSNVPEDHIIEGKYLAGELDRVKHAAMVLQEAPLYIKRLSDFGLQDIENTIKFGVRECKARYFFHDYIHSSMKILSEVSGKANVKGLREDNILFMIAVRLKDLAVEKGVFIETATQLNGDYRNAQIYDQNLLRGAKAIADKIDCGMIMLEATQEDKEALKTLINQKGFPAPDIKIAVYKNRRGRYKDVIMWCQADRGVCKITPKFVTDYQYQLIEVPALKVNVIPRDDDSEWNGVF